MSWIARGLVLTLALYLFVPAAAEEPVPEDSIAWNPDLSAAFAEAKAERKILMICVNAKHVAGRGSEEPAAKGLREVVYKNASVVEWSRDFVCVLLTEGGSSEDYGELRMLGIDGDIVSPQHIFVHPDGGEILYRKEYWSYGQGEPAVDALIGMMKKARAKLAANGSDDAADSDADAVGPPPEGAERVAWIADQVQQVLDRAGRERKNALDRLVENDRDGDCVDPLIELLPLHKKNHFLLTAIVRALGRDGLVRAALPIVAYLGHKDESLRANAAVSLEYIGSRDKKVVAALRKAADRQKDEVVANHMYRALGRCGLDDAKARALLLKKAAAGKSEFSTYGPCIGLAYFEGDEKAARGVEKLLKQIGVPGSRRGGGQNTVKRGLLSWTLAAIGDEKSGKFVREELLARLENIQAFWVAGLRAFWSSVAQKCEGDESQMAGIEAGVRIFVSVAKDFGLGRYGAETRHLMDDARKDRGPSTFVPLGDNLLATGE